MTNKRISFLVLALALAPAAAHAEPTPKPDIGNTQDTNADAVQELMRTGVAAYKNGDLQAARAAFLQAWAIRPHYAIAEPRRGRDGARTISPYGGASRILLGQSSRRARGQAGKPRIDSPRPRSISRFSA